MERLGRHSIGRAGGAEHPNDVWDVLTAPFMPAARREGPFVTALDRMLRPVGGRAAYGGLRLIAETAGDPLRTEALGCVPRPCADAPAPPSGPGQIQPRVRAMRAASWRLAAPVLPTAEDR
jgi:hypothetical protein